MSRSSSRAHAPHVAAHEFDLAAGDGAVLAHVLHDGECDGGLAAAGFAHDADGFAGIDRKVEIIDSRHLSSAGVVGDRDIVAFENGHGHGSIPQRDFTQAIGQEIEAKDQRGDCQRRPDHGVGRHGAEAAHFGNHLAPVRVGRRQPKA